MRTSAVAATSTGKMTAKTRDALHAEAKKAGRTMHHFSHPIPNLGVIDDAGYDAIHERIRAEMDAGRMVYIHCFGGVGRTCTVVRCMPGRTTAPQWLASPSCGRELARLTALSRSPRSGVTSFGPDARADADSGRISTPGGGDRDQLSVDVLADDADACVAEDRRHTDDRLIARRLRSPDPDR